MSFYVMKPDISHYLEASMRQIKPEYVQGYTGKQGHWPTNHGFRVHREKGSLVIQKEYSNIGT